MRSVSLKGQAIVKKLEDISRHLIFFENGMISNAHFDNTVQCWWKTSEDFSRPCAGAKLLLVEVHSGSRLSTGGAPPESQAWPWGLLRPWGGIDDQEVTISDVQTHFDSHFDIYIYI